MVNVITPFESVIIMLPIFWNSFCVKSTLQYDAAYVGLEPRFSEGCDPFKELTEEVILQLYGALLLQ